MPRYYELKKEFYAQKIKYSDIAEMIGRSIAYVSLRMEGKAKWTIDDCYLILIFIQAPEEKIYFYFPPRVGKGV